MSANETLAQLHPALSGFKTMFAGFTGWLHIRVGVFQMFTLGHCSSVERGLDDWHGDEDSGGRAQSTGHRAQISEQKLPSQPLLRLRTVPCALRPFLHLMPVKKICALPQLQDLFTEPFSATPV